MRIERGSYQKLLATLANEQLELNCVIGNFNAIHLGHANLIHQFSLYLHSLDICIITFSQSIKSQISQENPFLSLESKLEIFAYLKVNMVIVIDIDEQFTKLSAMDFISFLKTIGVKKIALGSDFHFGYQRTGSIEMLKPFFEIFQVKTTNDKISSTEIKHLVEDGRVDEANKLLIKPFFIEGLVVSGREIGRSISYPTANIDPNFAYTIPKEGVYYTSCSDGINTYDSITNIGYNPTVNDDQSLIKIETHILDQNLQLYGKKIKIILHQRLRSEIKFPNLEALKKQISLDIQEVIALQEKAHSIETWDYPLDPELIAQTPLSVRSQARLLKVSRFNNEVKDDNFSHIADYFYPGDVLVLNNSKVMCARIFGMKVQTNAKLEFLLLERINNRPVRYECLCRGFRKVHVDNLISFSDRLKAKVYTKSADTLVLEFIFDEKDDFYELLEEIGHIPLPPYIKTKLVDNNDYQTVYADVLGSSAAPTAGLHFTEELLDDLRLKGVEIINITLHVGLGTFLPVKTSNYLNHPMHEEIYFIDSTAANQLNAARKAHRRIVACGTTVVRALEDNFQEGFHNGIFRTKIYITEGFKFQAIDSLITNFHLPKSTLLLLVSAFCTKDIIFHAYKHAIVQRYRFFSFGDAMIIY
ncbi:MAG: tRNA preQ1(34) S-adenosylmethionine ribosyltransferase-isomerase QueA [Acholeplasmatales bacterium]|jgi:S-adenosylmethionine:tRNA ribosyltransferase-isomerase|nr:tRNA preQ1(34) S-adenosylmethionine ribosyltransferase-isomerase QueA [Acholeplasmatales bacterium]